MQIEQLCARCGSSWVTSEPNKEWDEISKRWIETQPEMCSDCVKDWEEV